MQASVNPFASDATQRVPLTYENLKMLERECFVTKEERKTLLLFCGWYPSLVLTHHSNFSLLPHLRSWCDNSNSLGVCLRIHTRAAHERPASAARSP